MGGGQRERAMEKHDGMKENAYVMAHVEIPHLRGTLVMEQTTPFQDFGCQAIATKNMRILEVRKFAGSDIDIYGSCYKLSRIHMAQV